MQNIIMKGKPTWLVFDEIVHVNKHIPYTTLVPEVMRKMMFWNKVNVTMSLSLFIYQIILRLINFVQKQAVMMLRILSIYQEVG